MFSRPYLAFSPASIKAQLSLLQNLLSGKYLHNYKFFSTLYETHFFICKSFQQPELIFVIEAVPANILFGNLKEK